MRIPKRAQANPNSHEFGYDSTAQRHRECRQIVEPAFDHRRLVGVAIDVRQSLERALERGDGRRRRPAIANCLFDERCQFRVFDRRVAVQSADQRAIEVDREADQQPRSSTAWRSVLAGVVDEAADRLGSSKTLDWPAGQARRAARRETSTAPDRPIPWPVRDSRRCKMPSGAPPPRRKRSHDRRADGPRSLQPVAGTERSALASGSSAIACRRSCRSESGPIAAAALRAS